MTVAAALIAESFAVVGDHDVPEDRENSIWSWHLHDEVCVMRYGHEHGEHRSSEDGVVR
jgi:hypothetical protein